MALIVTFIDPDQTCDTATLNEQVVVRVARRTAVPPDPNRTSTLTVTLTILDEDAAPAHPEFDPDSDGTLSSDVKFPLAEDHELVPEKTYIVVAIAKLVEQIADQPETTDYGSATWTGPKE